MTVTTGASTGLNASIAAEIRAWMGRRGVRQSQLARQLGENEQWVSVRLRGVTPLSVNDTGRIAEALGIRMVDLLPQREREVTVTYADAAPDRSTGSPVRRTYPTGGRPQGRSDKTGPPSGPRRTSLVRRSLAA